MNKYKEVLEKLRGGEMALEVDGTRGLVLKAMRIIWPEDMSVPGEILDKFYSTHPHYAKCWYYSDTNPYPSSITVTEFLRLYEGAK